MNPKNHHIKQLGKIAAGLLFGASLTLASSASAQLTVATSSQQGTANTWPFTPTWTPATDSLIAGLVPTTATGNFTLEVAGRNVNSLTAGGSLAINQIPATIVGNNTTSTNYVTYGNGSGAGSLLIYTLPASANGYNLTNITVDGGWANNGRDALGFTVLYSTAANPTNFIYLTTINYNPATPNNTPIANQAIIKNAVAGGQIAANVAAVEFILNFPSVENGFCGIGAITVEGTAATSKVSAVAVTTANQSGSNPLTPTWTAETPNLIAGLLPSSSSGSFALESSGGLPVLTDGAIGKSGTLGGFATCGASGGTSLIYTLTNVVNGTDVTNIVVYSGWGDTGRFGQYYTLSYSTIAAPTTFIPITTVFYWPGVLSENGGGSAQANRVAIFNSTGAALAGGVANLKFDFSSPPSAGSFNNGYQGYSEIIVQGQDTATPPPPPSPLLSQDVLPAYAATVVGDQVVFTAAYSNSPPASLQWQFINASSVVSDIPGATSATLTLNNVQVSDSGSYRLEALNATNGAASPSYSSAAPLVVNSTPVAVGNVIMNYAEQSGQGPLSPVNASTNFYPTWTVDTANDLILGSLTNASPDVPGTFIAGTGNFDMNIPVYGTNAGPLSADPAILSDGSGGYIPYWVNVGGSISQCSCGVGGAGDTMTYTLPNSAANGFDVTNIAVYGGWGDSGRNEQKYQVLYSTIYNPTVFTSLGTFDYNPNNPANHQSATRTILIPVSGALAKNVAAVQINWNVSVAPKNNWEGYTEIVVKGTPSGVNPILVQDTLPSYAATVVGDQIAFTAAFSNAPAVNVQWQFISTNNVVSDIPGATSGTLTLNNLQLTDAGSYRLKAVSTADSTAIIYSTPAPLVVNNVPAPVGNILVTTANQSGLGPISGVNSSTNFTPTWTEDTTGDLVLNSVYDGSFP
ncbi:MAG TPA: immunoglobulin domain-containing protein, partial [Verrucomicrobiae bacterium]